MVLLHDCFKNCACLSIARVLISELATMILLMLSSGRKKKKEEEKEETPNSHSSGMI